MGAYMPMKLRQLPPPRVHLHSRPIDHKKLATSGAALPRPPTPTRSRRYSTNLDWASAGTRHSPREPPGACPNNSGDPSGHSPREPRGACPNNSGDPSGSCTSSSWSDTDWLGSEPSGRAGSGAGTCLPGGLAQRQEALPSAPCTCSQTGSNLSPS